MRHLRICHDRAKKKANELAKHIRAHTHIRHLCTMASAFVQLKMYMFIYRLDTDTYKSIWEWYLLALGLRDRKQTPPTRKKEEKFINLRIYFCKSMGQKRLKTKKKLFLSSIFETHGCQGTARNESWVSMERKKGFEVVKMQRGHRGRGRGRGRANTSN